MHADASAPVRALDLAPHPEGGYYRETFRSAGVGPTPRGPRAASTAIDALLPAGARFALCGCTVAPGFDLADLELAPGTQVDAGSGRV